MSYDLHITKADDWIDAAETPIGRQQWEAFATGEGRLIEDGWVEWKDIGRQPIWTYTSTDGEECSLSWRNGKVDVTGRLSDETCRELTALATALDANLIGDDGERYTE